MKKTKPTWEDVPGILAQILEALQGSCCSCQHGITVMPDAPAPEPAETPQVEEQQTEAPAAEEVTDRKSIRDAVLEFNRANPGKRKDVRAIIAALTPSGDGKFDDVPDANLQQLKTQIEALNG